MPRIKKPKIVEPPTIQIEPKTRSPVYDTHSYWSKKPYTVTDYYIRHFTATGEIVLDPFAGFGVTNIEALRLGRKSVALDINPLSSFILGALTAPVNITALRKSFTNIAEEVKTEIETLYGLDCEKCEQPSIANYFVWDEDKLTEVRYECNQCQKTYSSTKFAKADLVSEDRLEMPSDLPDAPLIYNSRINIPKGTKVSDLFTKRALIGLATIRREILKVKDKDVRNALLLAFSGSLRLGSKSAQRRQDSGSVAQVPNLWIPSVDRLEKNVWRNFESKFNDVIKGLEILKSEFSKPVKRANSFEELKRSGDLLIITGSARKMKDIPDGSIDYVITDPPYYDEVPYLELSRLWCVWLGLPYDGDLLKQEIVVSNSPEREKDFDHYKTEFGEAIKEIKRVLKPGKYSSIWFHNRNLKVWNLLVNALIDAGFRVANVVYQPHSLIAFKQAKDKSGTLQGHFIINCVNPSREERFPLIIDEDVNRALIKASQRVIVEQGGATLSEIYACLIPVLVEYGALDLMAKISTDLEPFLSENFERRGNKWYIREKDYATLDKHIPLRSRLYLFLSSIVNRLDREKGEFSIDDVYQNLLPLVVNGQTPEKHEIVTILERVAKQTGSGNWKKRKATKQSDLFEAASKAAETLPEIALTDEHDQVITVLATLGTYAGCSVHIGKRERQKNKALADLSLDSLPINGLPKEALRVIEQIDVLWLRGRTVISAFEVEGTTPVYSGLARFEELAKAVPMIRMKAYVVFPSNREEKVRAEFTRLAFRDVARREGWRFVNYEALFNLYEAIRQDRVRIQPEALDDISVSPFAPY